MSSDLTSDKPRVEASADSSRKAVLEDLLRGFRLQRSAYLRSELRAPWGLSIASAAFHIVAHGTCWLQVDGVDEPLQLSEGDFVVVTESTPHMVRDQLSTPTVNLFDLINAHASGDGAFCFGGDGTVTRLVCGGMLLENGPIDPLLAVLPPLLHVKWTEEGTERWLGLATQQALSELNSGGVGAAEIVTRLAEILFLKAVRAYFDENLETAHSGFLAAIRDHQIGPALAILHSHPSWPWSLTSLARQVGMSRSAFAARFMTLVGEPPLHYFRRLRIKAAASQLRSSDAKISAVATTAGYKSVAAFAKSFRRLTGMTPGEYRQFRDRWPPVGRRLAKAAGASPKGGAATKR